MKKSIKQSTLMFVLNSLSIFLVLAIVILFALTILLNRDIEEAHSNRFSLTENANRFMDGSAYLTDEVRAYAATGKQIHRDNYWNEIDTLKNRDIGIENMKTIGITAGEQTKIDEMSARSNTLVPLEEDAMNSVLTNDMSVATAYVYGDEYGKEIALINQNKAEFLSMLDKRTGSEISQLTVRKDVLSIMTVAIAVVTMFLQFCVFISTRKKVIKPIIAVQKSLMEMADGNLSSKLSLEPDTSEIGMLVHAMLCIQSELKKYIGDISEKLSDMANHDMSITVDIDYIGDYFPIKQAMLGIVDSLNRALTQIHEVANQVSGGAEQVAHGAQALAQGATEQASSVEELAAVIDEVRIQIRHSSQTALHASDLANLAGVELVESNRKMGQMSQAMQEIDTASLQIGKIIKTIEDIAFQTNILALNAAVEAARAGQAGKGFAVVADEVRNLASKSAEASQNTAKLIGTSMQTIENGTKISTDTAQTLLHAIDNAKQATDAMDVISKDSTDQTDSIHQVAQGVEQISAVVQTNSATAEESAAASQQLSAQARLLLDLVGKFHLRK